MVSSGASRADDGSADGHFRRGPFPGVQPAPDASAQLHGLGGLAVGGRPCAGPLLKRAQVEQHVTARMAAFHDDAQDLLHQGCPDSARVTR